MPRSAVLRLLKTHPAWWAAVLLAAITASFALWDPLESYERAHVSRTTHQTMESLRADLKSDMESRLLAQIRVAELWRDRLAFSEKEREISCRLFLDHHPGYMSLAWSDPGYHVLYAIDRGGHVDPAAEADTGQVLKAIQLSSSALEAGNPIVTPRFHLPDGRSALRVIVPVHRHAAIAGFLTAVVDLNAAFDAMVDDHKDLGYSVSVGEGGTEIYRMPGSGRENEATLAQQGTLQLPGTAWRIRVWPGPEVVSSMQSSLPRMAMILGGLLGAVLMLAIHFGAVARRGSRELQRAHDGLEQRVKERTLELERVNDTLQTEVVDRKRAEDSYRDLSGRLLRLQDEERRRIARELHDGTAQMLGALSINVDRALMLTRTRNLSRLTDVLNESGGFVEQVTQDIRTLSYLLHPPMLDDLGLEYVLPWYTDGFSRRSGIAVTLSITPDLGRLPADLELTLFRIVQEALGNVHRHSGSPAVAISLTRDGECLTLEISDHGSGLPSAVLEALNRTTVSTAQVGVGIAGMRERVRQLHGRMEVASDASGTTIRTVLPVPVEEPADPCYDRIPAV